MIIILLFSFLDFFLKKSNTLEKKHFIEKKENENLLPPKPKEKWKYVQKLENL